MCRTDPPRGRQAGLFAPAGLGKSLLAVDVSAAKATGRPVLGQPAQAPVSVVYIDMEMTPEDLRERLGDLGYGEDDDFSNLHYYQLTALPPLDTIEGGDALMAIVERYDPEVVVLDTMARVVAGDENSADTFRAFFRCTGCRLKAAGVALLRLDHAGKDPSRDSGAARPRPTISTLCGASRRSRTGSCSTGSRPGSATSPRRCRSPGRRTRCSVTFSLLSECQRVRPR